jgi:hypothetical protein
VAACGKVNALQLAQGAQCSSSGSCMSGHCADGVCCDRACDATCEACAAAKTGGADGTCAAVTAATDPDNECSDQGVQSCGANGTGCNGNAAAPDCVNYAADTPCAAHCTASGSTTGLCDGNGTCVTGAPTTCGNFNCNAQATTCLTTCSSPSDCISTAHCATNGACVVGLRIALETGVNSVALTQSFPPIKAALENRGHTVTVVHGTDIDTAGELASFDVVVTGCVGAGTCNDDRTSYDAVIATWVQGGGGLVASGWELYQSPPPNFASVMPNAGSSYDTGAQQQIPVGTLPIVTGITSFTANATYLPFGGAPKAGSIQFLKDAANNSTAQAWTQGTGRVVFLGPLYMDDFSPYQNQSLTDGSNPMALEVLLRSIEWAGKGI